MSSIKEHHCEQLLRPFLTEPRGGIGQNRFQTQLQPPLEAAKDLPRPKYTKQPNEKTVRLFLL